MSPLEEDRLRQAVREAVESIDKDRIALFSRLTPTERLQMMFDMCNAARDQMFAEERLANPGISEADVWRRVRDRILASHDD